MSPLLLLLGLAGCAPLAPRMPGPLGPVGRVPHADVALGPEEPAPFVEPEEEQPERRERKKRRKRSELGDAIAEAAAHYLGHRPKGFRDDCSGFVCAAVTRAGLPLEGNSRSLWETARSVGAVHHHKEPRPGDIAFFDNTYDRDRDGRWNDEITHVAVVIDVGEDGTIRLAHGGTSRGRSELRMNLRRPEVHLDREGAVLNDFLRRPSSGDTERSRYLAGQLWRAFATLDPEDSETWSGS